MTTDLDETIRRQLADMANGLGNISPPSHLPEARFPLVDLPNDDGGHRRRPLALAVAAVVVLGSASVGLLASRAMDWTSSNVATPGAETGTDTTLPPTPTESATNPEFDESFAPTTDPDHPPSTIVESAPGQWRPPYPMHSATLLRYDPGSFPPASLPDGRHFGILDGIVDTDGELAVRFSLGRRVVEDEAAAARSQATEAAGGDEWMISHDWWAAEWGVGMYIYPDFDLPVLVLVDPALTITVYRAEGPTSVTWTDFTEYADGVSDLPYHWTGHAFIEVNEGRITHLENMWTP